MRFIAHAQQAQDRKLALVQGLDGDAGAGSGQRGPWATSSKLRTGSSPWCRAWAGTRAPTPASGDRGHVQQTQDRKLALVQGLGGNTGADSGQRGPRPRPAGSGPGGRTALSAVAGKAMVLSMSTKIAMA
jgi:hypothetical protein